MSAILARRWYLLILPCLLCLGCQGGGERVDVVTASEQGAAPAADGDEPAELAVENLQPGDVSAEGEYSEPAKQLLADLKSAHPGMAFSVSWTPARVHVTVHKTGAEQPDRKELHQGIIRLCLATSGPPTKEIWVSSRSPAGSEYVDKGGWDAFEDLLGD